MTVTFFHCPPLLFRCIQSGRRIKQMKQSTLSHLRLLIKPNTVRYTHHTRQSKEHLIRRTRQRSNSLSNHLSIRFAVPSRSLFFMNSILNTSASEEINQFESFTNDDGHVMHWRSTTDFIPIREGLYGDITIGQEMEMEFDFIWWGYSDDPYSTGTSYENFFRVGFSHHLGTSCEGQGSRYPYVAMCLCCVHLSITLGI